MICHYTELTNDHFIIAREDNNTFEKMYISFWNRNEWIREENDENFYLGQRFYWFIIAPNSCDRNCKGWIEDIGNWHSVYN